MKTTLLILLVVVLMLGGGFLTFAQTNTSMPKSRITMSPKSKTVENLKNPLKNFRTYKFELDPFFYKGEIQKFSRANSLAQYYRTLLFSNSKRLESKNVAVSLIRPIPETSPLGLENIKDILFSDGKVVVSNLYPNPVTIGNVSVDYSLDKLRNDEVKITIFNVLGSSVKELSLSKYEKNSRISVQEMTNGVYFYQLSIGSKTIATKKLIIQHSNQ